MCLAIFSRYNKVNYKIAQQRQWGSGRAARIVSLSTATSTSRAGQMPSEQGRRRRLRQEIGEQRLSIIKSALGHCIQITEQHQKLADDRRRLAARSPQASPL